MSFRQLFLSEARTPKDPKKLKIQSNCQTFFALLGSERVKAARKTLMKLTPGFSSHRRLMCGECSKVERVWVSRLHRDSNIKIHY
jgi:hypothetical protein